LPPHEPPVDAFGGELIDDPAAGMAGEDPGHDRLAAERLGDLGDVDPLVAVVEPLDLEQLVDRRVSGHAYDHAASASSSVGCAVVPPTARVESAPHAHPSASARSMFDPLSSPASTPASNESPAPT